MKHFLLTLLMGTSLVLTTQNAKACSCMPVDDNFCGTVQLDSTIKLIGRFKKLATYHYGFTVLRMQTYYGTETRDTLIVWGDNGALCRLYDGWAVGEEIILALQQCDLWGNTITAGYPPDLEEEDHYQVSGCGVYALNVVGTNVVGPITAPTTQSIPLTTFEADNCGISLGLPKINSSNLLLYPVPASDRLTIDFFGEYIIKAEIVDVRGAVVLTQQVNNTKADILLGTLTEGTYCLRLQTQQGVTTRRFQVVK